MKDLLEEGELGPAMRGLSVLQRRYVLAMAADPLGNPTGWARVAGYSDHLDRAKVSGHSNAHNPKVARAVEEVARQLLTSYGPMLGIGVMMRIARKDGHRDQLKAAEALANRSGFHEATEHRVLVDDARRDPVAMVTRVKELADQLGVDPAVLLGGMRLKQPVVIEHEAVPAPDEGSVPDRSDTVCSVTAAGDDVPDKPPAPGVQTGPRSGRKSRRADPVCSVTSTESSGLDTTATGRGGAAPAVQTGE